MFACAIMVKIIQSAQMVHASTVQQQIQIVYIAVKHIIMMDINAFMVP